MDYRQTIGQIIITPDDTRTNINLLDKNVTTLRVAGTEKDQFVIDGVTIVLNSTGLFFVHDLNIESSISSLVIETLPSSNLIIDYIGYEDADILELGYPVWETLNWEGQ